MQNNSRKQTTAKTRRMKGNVPNGKKKKKTTTTTTTLKTPTEASNKAHKPGERKQISPAPNKAQIK
jgi:hypothetical protein